MVVTIRYQSPRMELRHFRYFVAVAEELNFRKASQRLHVSRPALSKQVKDLEEEMGVRLLNRDTVSVSLTKAGEIFLADAQKLLLQAEASIERAIQAQAGHRGTLRIGSVGIIARDFLPTTLQQFRQRFPGVEVAFVEMLPTEQLEALEHGKIDIGFAYGKEVETMPNLRSLCVIQSVLGAAVSRQHPVVRGAAISLAELQLETILCVGGRGRSTHGESIQQAFAAEGLRPAKMRKIDGFDSLLTLVAADQGISLLPHVLDLAQQNIVIVPLVPGSADLQFQMWAVCQRDSASLHVQHFIELLEVRVTTSGAA
jgi:DNA-binding transcriptional LysR family regulator